MTSASNNSSAGTNGATVTTANSGNGSGTPFDAVLMDVANTVTYDTGQTPGGRAGPCIKCVTTNTRAQVQWTSATLGILTQAWGRVSFRYSALPTNQCTFLRVGGAASALVCRLQLTSAGKLTIVDGTGTTTSATTFAANTNYRVEWMVISSATVGQVEVKIYTAASPTVPVETLTTAATRNTGADMREWNYGTTAGLTTGNITVWIQDLNVNSVGYPLGPLSALSSVMRGVWPVRTAVASAIRGVWAVLSSVAAAVRGVWPVRAGAVSSLAGVWPVRAAVASVARGVWNVSGLVASAVRGVWAVRAAAVSHVTGLAPVRAQAPTSSTSGVWPVRARVPASAVSAVWNVLASAAASVRGVWPTRTALVRARAGVWAIRAEMTAAVRGEWPVHAPATSTLRGVWSVREAAGASVSGRWPTLGAVASSTSGAWRVRRLAGANVTGVWPVDTLMLSPLGPHDGHTVAGEPRAAWRAGEPRGEWASGQPRSGWVARGPRTEPARVEAWAP